ncbi:hypothetical protein AMQ84_11710 [Paenibacillus riograndensis]|uniref:Uncharacterized protein n=1 Tax=Paenibacillus riograndensis TaxID=483937 RepID=A0A132U255_9BACL|nr:hypothetical protein [Paenibacillus riograndensis]KWX77658.1 hypothetical protein AMQ84_11710 [Paenibacillus riograndensis]
MEEIRIQKKDRAVSFRVSEEAGEFIVFDMSLSNPASSRTNYSGKQFREAWKAVESILGETAIPDEIIKYANS